MTGGETRTGQGSWLALDPKLGCHEQEETIDITTKCETCWPAGCYCHRVDLLLPVVVCAPIPIPAIICGMNNFKSHVYHTDLAKTVPYQSVENCNITIWHALYRLYCTNLACYVPYQSGVQWFHGQLAMSTWSRAVTVSAFKLLMSNTSVH